MGMYDHIVPEIDLPDECKSVGQWQTKDTNDQHLSTYVLRKDGTLWRNVWHFETVDGAPESPSSGMDYFQWRAEFQKRVYDEPVQEIHTGCIEFYGVDESKNWHNVVAFFDDGVCFRVKHTMDTAQ